jgi:hypothetical protein
MKAFIALAAAAALCGGAASAQKILPKTTTICLDVGGHVRPVRCRYMSASRIDKREDICQCLSGGQPIIVDVCPDGVNPPAESAAYERDRYAAIQKGSLVGQNWQGRPICVAPHQNTSG